MFSIFKGEAKFLDLEVEAWHLETWRWAIASFGGWTSFQQTPLVSPTPEYFPPGPAGGHEKALHVFGAVRRLMGMEDWSCRLQPTTAPASARLDTFVQLTTPGAPAARSRSRVTRRS
jgi:hypothetical protein